MRPRPGGARRPLRGFTLIELMVALGLGLFVVTVVIQGFAAAAAASNTNAAVAESHTNGRHAMAVLRRELRHAGLLRLVWEEESINADFLPPKDYGCGQGFVRQLSEGVTGSNDTNPYAASCLKKAADRDYARGDVLVLRRSALRPSTSFDSGAAYVQLSYGAAELFADTPPEAPRPPFDYRRLVSDVYFVNAFTDSADESPRVPALYRLRLSQGANPVMTPELVASNIEQFQIQFAVSEQNGNVRYENAGADTDWAGVKTARIWLLIRESTPEAGLVSGDYVLGDVTYQPGDNFRRAVYSATVAIRNPPLEE